MTRSRRLVLSRWLTRIRYARASGALRTWILWSLGAIVVAWVGWILVTGLLARRDALELRDRLNRAEAQVAEGNLVGARQTAAAIPALTDHARRLTSGPAWWAAAELPYVGRPFKIARDVTAVAQDFGQRAVPALVEVAGDLDPAKLRTAPDAIDLRPLRAAAPSLQGAAEVLDSALRQLDRAPRSSWLPQLDHTRASVETTMTSVSGYVAAAAHAARLLPSLLGGDGARRYFVGLQNEAEMRGTGGLPGAFAIVVATHGRIRFTHFESDTALLPPATSGKIETGLNFGAGYRSLYDASGPTELFQNSNLSPNFPYAAEIWSRMWTLRTGEPVDGAIAVDPQVLSNLLYAPGPVPTPEGQALTAANVVPLTERLEYSLFTDQIRRKQFLVDALHAVANRVLDGGVSPQGLVQAMSASSRERRVLIWTRDKADEQLLLGTNYSGAIPDTRTPFVGVVMNNLVGGKLDYYLARSVAYAQVGCGTARDMLVTIKLTNTAPPTGLPDIVTARLDQSGLPPDNAIRPGDNRTLLDYFATAGAQLLGVTIDGVPGTAAVVTELGHPVYRFDLELPRGRTRTVVLRLSEPGEPGPVEVWHQPGVTPFGVSGFAQTCP